MRGLISSLKSHRTLKIIVSLIFTFAFSSSYLYFTNPCTNSIYIQCDYYYGFPIPFWLVTDFISKELLLMFVGGLLGNIIIWYLLISFGQYLYKLVSR